MDQHPSRPDDGINHRSKKMDGFEHEVGIAADFLSSKWDEFLAFVAENEIDEPRAEELVSAMEKFSGRR